MVSNNRIDSRVQPPVVEYVASAEADMDIAATATNDACRSECMTDDLTTDHIPFASMRASSASTRSRSRRRGRACQIAFTLTCVVAAIIVWACLTASLLLTQYNITTWNYVTTGHTDADTLWT